MRLHQHPKGQGYMATPAMRQYGNLKNHRSHFQQARLTLESLAERHGIGLGSRYTPMLATEARRLQVAHGPLRQRPAVVACRAELDDVGWADPCLIVPADWPIALLPPYKR